MFFLLLFSWQYKYFRIVKHVLVAGIKVFNCFIIIFSSQSDAFIREAAKKSSSLIGRAFKVLFPPPCSRAFYHCVLFFLSTSFPPFSFVPTVGISLCTFSLPGSIFTACIYIYDIYIKNETKSVCSILSIAPCSIPDTQIDETTRRLFEVSINTETNRLPHIFS